MESIDKSLECVLEKNMRPWGHSNSTWSLNFVITIKNQFYIWTNVFAWQQRVMRERERERERDLMMDFHSLWSEHSQFIPYSLPWNFLDTRNLTVLCLSGFTFVKKGNFWKNLRRRALVTRQRFLFNYTTSFCF